MVWARLIKLQAVWRWYSGHKAYLRDKAASVYIDLPGSPPAQKQAPAQSGSQSVHIN